MRRALSVFLVLFFSLSPLAATFDGGDDAHLPACCRRLGAHHCAMSAPTIGQTAQATSDTPVLAPPSKCPVYPGNANAILRSVHALTASTSITAVLLAQYHVPLPFHAAARMSQFRTRTGRSPPKTIFG
jgi:hypothetical protein